MSAAGLAILMIIASATAWGTYVLVRPGLRSLLDGVVNRSAATQYYLRSLLVCLMFGAWSGVLSNKWDPTSGGPVMEHVWTVAGAMSSSLGIMVLILCCFAVLATIITASLGRRPAEPPVCLACGYSLKGQIDDLRCPECGTPYSGTKPP